MDRQVASKRWAVDRGLTVARMDRLGGKSVSRSLAVPSFGKSMHCMAFRRSAGPQSSLVQNVLKPRWLKQSQCGSCFFLATHCSPSFQVGRNGHQPLREKNIGLAKVAVSLNACKFSFASTSKQSPQGPTCYPRVDWEQP